MATILIYDSPETNADLYYACGFSAPDPFLYVEHNGKKHLFLSQLEFNRGARDAKVDKVHSIEPFFEKATSNGKTDIFEAIYLSIQSIGVAACTVQSTAGIALVENLRQRGITIDWRAGSIYPTRFIKNEWEKKEMKKAQKAIIVAMKEAEAVLSATEIKKHCLYLNKKPLTSEGLRSVIETSLLKNGYLAQGTIVSGGDQAVDPHDRGSGPLRAHEAIIIDIFPKSIATGYFGDFTRTVCRGKAPEILKKQYKAVKDAQELGVSMIKDGILGSKIHQAIVDLFESRGFMTGPINGKPQGFIHSTGHGLGLEIHEFPRISAAPITLKAGMITSVEPGLYYYGQGGIRIEDIVFITKEGCEVLATYPKRFEIL